MRGVNKVWNEQSLKEAIKEQWGEFGVHMEVFNFMLKLIESMIWTEYSWENRKSHPPKPDRYLIYRKGCNKMQFEQWNGSGWASSNGDCTHYILMPIPDKFNVKVV